jgi:hypothetical protein
MNRITPSKLQSLFPRQIPKDIVTVVDGFIFGDIRDAAKNIMYAHVNTLSPVPIAENLFIEKVTETFVEKIGNCFKDFLQSYESVIKEEGSNAIYEVIYNVHDFIWFILYPDTLYSTTFGKSIPVVNDFNRKILTNMGRSEGYFYGNDPNMMLKYLDSLKI